jgi:hydrogenase expression/formation protein HypC
LTRHGTLMAEVDFGGVSKDVCLEYLPEVTPGDYVIVHVGFAIQRLDERLAIQTLAALADLGLLEEEFTDPLAGAETGAKADAEAGTRAGTEGGTRAGTNARTGTGTDDGERVAS